MYSAHRLAVLILVLMQGQVTPKSGRPAFCLNGSTGVCGPFNDFQCRHDSFCSGSRYRTNGLCCRPRPTHGSCPPTISEGICKFDPQRNCLSDSQCPRDFLCCPHGCGRVCKYRYTGGIYQGTISPPSE